MNKKIYLAGFEVFHPQADKILDEKKRRCLEFGFIPLSPFDNEISADGMKALEIAMIVKSANKKMIESCDIVIANLNSFRGFEPDSGTSFEIGYAEALGKTIYGFVQDASLDLINRYQKMHGTKNDQDTTGYNLERFGYPINLMLAAGNNLFSTFEECLEDLVKKYKIH